MIRNIQSRISKLMHDERGQVLPITAVMFVVLLGMTGLVVDLGHVGYVQRELQSSTDAAALAGAQNLPATTATTVATSYSAAAGGYNVRPNLPNVTMVSGWPKAECLNTLKAMGQACAAPMNANAIQVKQQITIPLYFASVIGVKSYTIVTSATASMRGSTPTPYNIAIILDSTLSQTNLDDNCGTGITEMQCQLLGVQALLKTMNPCATNLSSCTIINGQSINSVDRVALFTFPAGTTATASIDSSCTTPIPSSYQYSDPSFGGYTMFNWSPPNNQTQTPYSGVPTSGPYPAPSVGANSYSSNTVNLQTAQGVIQTENMTYQLVPFVSDYKTSDKASTLNANSALVKATGYVSNCGGMLPSNFDGEEGTYYAGAIYAAQSALSAEQAAFPGSKNVIIILSDGDANLAQWWNGFMSFPAPAGNSGNYPSYVGDCAQGVTAAQYAQAAGTRIYSIAYGSPPTGCSTDVGAGNMPNITPCTTMQDMASAAEDFFSDYLQTNANSNCMSSAQSETNINAIFQIIANDLTVARLIPDNTT